MTSSRRSRPWLSPGRRGGRFAAAFERVTAAHAVAIAFVLALAGLAVAPLISLVAMAARRRGDLGHLAAYVLPVALMQTALLLAGVAVVAGVTGIGTAWLVTAYRFPGRGALRMAAAAAAGDTDLHRRLHLCDLLDAAGPVQTALRAAAGWRSPHDYWFPEIRSLGGAIFVMGFVLYPYVYLSARAMFQTQSACLMEVARTLGATPLDAAAPRGAAAGAAGARGRTLARACSRRSTTSAPANISACAR